MSASMDAGTIIFLGVVGSLAAGLMTSVGALPVLLNRQPSEQTRDVLLGFAAGVMLAASFFSLIMPSLAESERLFGAGILPASIAVGGILLGAGAVAALNELLPHEHFVQGREGPASEALRRVWLFVFAIAIHNFPEGLAVGVGFGGGNVANGTALAMGIGLQNVPEGLAVAVALRGEGYGRWRAFLIASLTGLVEPIGGFLGASAVANSQLLLPWGLAFAAGAMLYVISHEIIPETHRHGFQKQATAGLIVGLVIMLFLDVTLSGSRQSN
jgi:zinc transporter, ZIP family